MGEPSGRDPLAPSGDNSATQVVNWLRSRIGALGPRDRYIVLGYSLVVTWLIAQAIDKTIGLRVTPAQETSGIDLAEHAEVGYDLSKVQYSTYNKTLLIADPNATRDNDATKVSA